MMLRIQSLVGLAMTIVGTVMSLAFLGGGFVTGFFGLIILIVGIIFRSSAKKKLTSLCKKCGESLKGVAYKFNEVETYQGKYARPSGDIFTKVEFTTTCPSCSTVKVFKKEYNAYDSKMRKHINIKPLIEKDAKKIFGH